MRQMRTRGLMITLYIICIVISCSNSSHGNTTDGKVLNVGEELWKETLPLKMGSRLYQLQGLKPDTWYEVKISYPASIPARFSIQLKRGDLESALTGNRRLLNTEKLIFKTESLGSNDQGGMYVLVSVEPEGVVAIPNVQEREHIIFNIVCDELLLGIPYKAWWVVGFVLVCLVLAFTIPAFLPPFLLRPVDQNASKDS
ncbi:uncharacterized protein Pyn_06405 [Prunus yedoensis var. nudiflora]|uniref:Uncharacterized protein n=1 Tax=Prunus yedoensis var. nudiflora TaxID=2094558 RepID=A0A314ZAU4_PRUYE|nr:uncharacterized protein Pyn_06405 [Prunus yedoensis var. nudiflora]